MDTGHTHFTEDDVLWDYVGLEIITFSKIYCEVAELWKEIFCHRLYIGLGIMRLYNFKLFHTQGIHRRLCIM